MAEPALWHDESLNLLRLAVVRKGLTPAAAREAAALWRQVPVTWYAPRSEDGISLLDGALAGNLSVYDATYAALARALNCPLLTEHPAILDTGLPGVTVMRCRAWQT